MGKYWHNNQTLQIFDRKRKIFQTNIYFSQHEFSRILLTIDLVDEISQTFWFYLFYPTFCLQTHHAVLSYDRICTSERSFHLINIVFAVRFKGTWSRNPSFFVYHRTLCVVCTQSIWHKERKTSVRHGNSKVYACKSNRTNTVRVGFSSSTSMNHKQH